MKFKKNFKICGLPVGEKNKVLIIGEAGVNHFGNLNEAKKLIKLAKNSKCDIFKTQHYSANQLVGPSAKNWQRRLSKKELKDYEIEKLFNFCKKINIPFLCTPHDEKAFDFLNYELKVKAFKIGSGEIQNWPFIDKIASTKKPVILSTGMYTLQDLKEVIKIFEMRSSNRLAILHCVTAYPANYRYLNLNFIQQIKKIFDGPVGYSDHTEDDGASLAAVALGAKIIEKHITIKKNVKDAQDWKVSNDNYSMPIFVKKIRNIEMAIKNSKKPGISEEKAKKWAMKSITAKIDINKNTKITQNHLILQRPGHGYPGKDINFFLNKKNRIKIKKGQILKKKNFY
ncbi:MAG: N-acylneuraminate-9-phosphate synthase [Pelagibacteraceae bacterium]|nr:N-acylneuraminate-9-phosphate synthase [Pelagibacteraceae bacterium]